MASYYREYTSVSRLESREITEKSNDVSVLPLSREGSQVERALAKFKSDVRSRTPLYFMEGKVTDMPALNITISKEDRTQVLFQHPYDNVEEIYSLAEQSQVDTATKPLFRPESRRPGGCSNVKVLNQEWNDTVSSVCDQIRQVLAPGATKVTTNLSKCLIYSEKKFIDLHQDAQLADRMFATLMFFLPVYHLGGEFSIIDPECFGDYIALGKSSTDCPNLEHSQEDSTVAKLGMKCSWVAFYADIHHSVSIIKKGYHVILNYSLSFEGAMSPSHQLSSFNLSTSSVITDYFSTHTNSMIAIPLRFNYTLSTLSPEYLKGYDAHLYNALSEVSNPQLQFIIGFDKMRVTYRWYDGIKDKPTKDKLFQGIFVLGHDMARQFFDVSNERQRLMKKVDRRHQQPGCDDDSVVLKKYADIRSKCNGEYLKLMEIVKKSQESSHVEWIVKRGKVGNPVEMKANIYFEDTQLGRLRSTCPSMEYYYLSAAIVVRMDKENKQLGNV